MPFECVCRTHVQAGTTADVLTAAMLCAVFLVCIVHANDTCCTACVIPKACVHNRLQGRFAQPSAHSLYQALAFQGSQCDAGDYCLRDNEANPSHGCLLPAACHSVPAAQLLTMCLHNHTRPNQAPSVASRSNEKANVRMVSK